MRKPIEYSTKSEKFSRKIRDIVETEIKRMTSGQDRYQSFREHGNKTYGPKVRQTMRWLPNGYAIHVIEKERKRRPFHLGNKYSYKMRIEIWGGNSAETRLEEDKIRQNIKLKLDKSLEGMAN